MLYLTVIRRDIDILADFVSDFGFGTEYAVYHYVIIKKLYS